jgi:hypothetical protein
MKTTKINKYLEEAKKIGVDKISALKVLNAWKSLKKQKQITKEVA